MERPSQMQTPWQEPDPIRFATSAQSSPELGQIPGIATALDRQLPITADHRLPPIATTFDAYVPRLQDGKAFVDLGTARSPEPISPQRSSSARPEKRPRWHLSHDSASTFSAPGEVSHHKQEDNRTTEAYAAWTRPENSHLSSRRESVCSNCANTDDLVARVVSGLLSLEESIRNTLALSKASRNNTNTEITKFGLRHSLSFVSHRIDENSRLVREVAATRPGQARLAAGVANDTEPGSQPGNFNDTTELTERHLKRRASCLEDQISYGAPGTIQNLQLGPPDDNSHSTLLHTIHTMKKNYHVEPPPARAAQSPRGSPPISAFRSNQSPAPSQPSSRTLPSPSSYVPYPSSASSILSSYGDGSLSNAQASHLQDLQHQISTKTLALQTLQREHDQLLAAFSRSQIRCTTLDKKSQVSDHEINTLAEEKVRLQQQVEALETQVEELAAAKDEAQRQLAADGAQWKRIMAMSSQLQIRSAEETRHFRSDREAWERDRDGLQRRIEDLEAGRSTLGPSDSSAIATPISRDDVLASTSLEMLRGEILRQRRRCEEMESILRDIQGETEHMGPTLAALTNMNERISALSSKTRSDTITGQKSETANKSGEGS